MARPSSFTQEIAEAICAALPLEDGGLEAVCRNSDGIPDSSTVYRWLADPSREEFRAMYARACEVRGHVQAQRALDDAMSAEDAALGRLRFDARKWTAAKLNSRYGDKVTQEHTGPNGGPVLTAAVDLTHLSEEQKRAVASIRLIGES